MVISVTSPEDFPYGCFHPARPYGNDFYEGSARWPTVAHYCLAHALASEADRERVRTEEDLAKAEMLAATLPRAQDWEASRFEVLRHAVLRSIEHHLRSRAVLLKTGNEPIEMKLGDDAQLGIGADGGGENLLGKALMAVREIVRRRAEDPSAIQCVHQDTDPEHLVVVCAHRLESDAPYRRHFTGVDRDYELLCQTCCDALPAPPPRRKLCARCSAHDLWATRHLPDVGSPAVLERPSDVHFTHEACTTPTNVIAFTPISRVPNVWLMLDDEGWLHRVDVRTGSIERGGRVPLDGLNVKDGLLLVAAPGGELAAIAEAHGQKGLVVEPASGRVVRALERGNYHVENCTFPLGFFEMDGRLLLVHGTDWNRLEVSDPRTGELLTARDEPEMDYFCSELTLSPDGRRVVDHGWIWHPYGQVQVFDLHRWVRENPCESEEGPSNHALAGAAYHWDGPVAWLDERTVAIWGEVEDDEDLNPIPAATIFDAESGKKIRSFLGPGPALASVPPWLVAWHEDQGTAVWDWATGERVAVDDTFQWSAVHPASHELLSREKDGRFRVHRLVAPR